ncbi:hypothetical protein QBC35DRAFT_273401 [Podospora australis]|uniref:Uncharacterized protein n=1 Tax=Podospora australis TaxID=1536484 RepID=A0AAN6WRW1_9PEZI|nr:hypothetical protein QBC35DRAFT_273401 [Podospora australis]
MFSTTRNDIQFKAWCAVYYVLCVMYCKSCVVARRFCVPKETFAQDAQRQRGSGRGRWGGVNYMSKTGVDLFRRSTNSPKIFKRFRKSKMQCRDPRFFLFFQGLVTSKMGERDPFPHCNRNLMPGRDRYSGGVPCRWDEQGAAARLFQLTSLVNGIHDPSLFPCDVVSLDEKYHGLNSLTASLSDAKQHHQDAGSSRLCIHGTWRLIDSKASVQPTPIDRKPPTGDAPLSILPTTNT